MFATLKDLPKARKFLVEQGFEVKKDNATLKGGRPAFHVRNDTNTWHLADYDLLAFASDEEAYAALSGLH